MHFEEDQCYNPNLLKRLILLCPHGEEINRPALRSPVSQGVRITA
jgi:hypothetical protein